MRLPQMLAITQAVAFMQPPLQPPTRLQAMSSGSSRILRTVSSFRHSAPDRFGRLGRPIAPLQSRTLVAMSASKFPTKLRGVLFDMDGTLSDSESLHFKAYQVVFAKEVPDWSANNGLMTRDYYNKNMGGKTKLGALTQVLPNTTPAQRDKLCSLLEEAFNDLANSELKCLPGVYDLVSLLAENKVKTALVTNAPPSEMHFALDILKLKTVFDALVPSAECPAGKPDPEPYLEALRRLGLRAEDCIAFEDSAAGIQSACDAGLFTVGVSTSRGAAELAALGASMIIRDFDDQHLLDAVRSSLKDERSGAA
jgi:HAD superfamily hydrolase (TIGR01509 family)